MIRFFIIFLLITLVWADGTVKVTVDSRKINEGDSVTLTVTATNIKDDPEVRIPKMQGLKVVNGPNKSSSTNVQFINGKMTKNSTVTLTWILIPVNKRVTKLKNLDGIRFDAGSFLSFFQPDTTSHPS